MYKRLILILLLVLIPALLPLRSQADTYPVLDGFHSFNSAISGTGGIRAIAVQPWDGKVIIGGDFTITGVDSIERKHLARLNTDGTLDASFTRTVSDPVNAVVIQPDPVDPRQSLILVGGSFISIDEQPRKGLGRIRCIDGSLDDFDPVTSAGNVTINAILLRPDGLSVLVGGSFGEIKAGISSPNLAGISVAGPGSGGQNWRNAEGIIGAAGNEVNAILLQGGMILAGGKFSITSESSHLARFQEDGHFDPDFSPLSPGGKVRCMALQADGRIIIAGEFPGGLPVRRLESEGTLDLLFNPSFDAGGYVASIVVQPDGKILAAGNFTTGPAPLTRQNLARINIDGTLDAARFQNLDAVVNVVAWQLDGKILAGGDFTTAGVDPGTGLGKPRSRLARFYPKGALDDDIPVDESFFDYEVDAISVHPDGLTIAGLFEFVQGELRIHIARLKEDWNLDPSFNPDLMINASVYVLAALPDNDLLVGGNFSAPQNVVVRLDPSGNPVGGAGHPDTTTFNNTINPLLDSEGTAQAIALLPNGMMYMAAQFIADASFETRFLSRIRNDGTRDVSFKGGIVNEKVNALAVQSDGKVLVGTDTGKLIRLLESGEPDTDWDEDGILQLNGKINSIVLQKQGDILVAGDFASEITREIDHVSVTWQRNIVRIHNEGLINEASIDTDFNVEVTFDAGGYGAGISGVTLQTNEDMLIYGVFDHVKDARGVVHPRDNVARIKPSGELETRFDLGAFTYVGGPVNNVGSVNLQPDGKIIIGGNFSELNGISAKNKLARFANDWAWQDLSVSANGSTITWLRDGTGPELSRVTFEDCANPDAPIPDWTVLGNGERIEGGWQLVGQNLAKGANRYVRARGYAAGDKGSAGSQIESVRLYYLEQGTQTVLTITAHAQSKTYGTLADPELTYSASGWVNGDTSAIITGSLHRAPGQDAGSYAIDQGDLSAGSNYTIAFNAANLTIIPATLSITAAAQSKTY
ncbi:MAG TPA: hypothetical protein DDY22_20035, partial [Geobacter sp.]|nr:hypothetical protein [Geobacter sp.]